MLNDFVFDWRVILLDSFAEAFGSELVALTLKLNRKKWRLQKLLFWGVKIWMEYFWKVSGLLRNRGDMIQFHHNNFMKILLFKITIKLCFSKEMLMSVIKWS